MRNPWGDPLSNALSNQGNITYSLGLVGDVVPPPVSGESPSTGRAGHITAATDSVDYTPYRASLADQISDAAGCAFSMAGILLAAVVTWLAIFALFALFALVTQ